MVGTATITPAIQEFYDRLLLVRARPLLTMAKWAQRRPIKTRNGTQIRFRRYNALAAATTPLSEGVTPLAGTMTYTDVTATLAQYGFWIPVTDKIQVVSPDPILSEATEELGEQEGLTIDTLMRNVMCGGDNAYLGNAVSDRTSIVTGWSTTDLDKILRSLKRANAKPITKMINPTTGVGTVPVDECFLCIVHTDDTTDLLGLTGFIPIEKYPAQRGVFPGEVGAYKKIRFIETTNSYIVADGGGNKGSYKSTTGTKLDVYCSLLFGANAYGECPLSGASTGTIIKTEGGTADPLNQRATAGWKAFWTAAILNSEWLVRYEHGVTA